MGAGHTAMGAGYKDNKPKDPSGSYAGWFHAAAGHPSDRYAKIMLQQGLGDVNGVHVTIDQYQKLDHWCDGCAKGKCKSKSHKARDKSKEWPGRPNMLHGVDTTGKTIRSLWGHQYSTVIKDHHDGRTWSYAHRKKSELSSILSLHEHDARMEGRLTAAYQEMGGVVDLNVLAYRSDNAGEFKSRGEAARRREEKIKSEWTVPNDGHGQQNAVAERAIGLTRTIATILIYSDLHTIPKKMARRLWPYAYRHAANLQLFWPTSHNRDNLCPAMKRFAEGMGARKAKWRSSLYHIWGSRMVVLDVKNKHEPRGRSMYFMGVPKNFTPGVLGWDINRPTKRPQVFYSVIFQEDAALDCSGQGLLPSQMIDVPTTVEGAAHSGEPLPGLLPQIVDVRTSSEEELPEDLPSLINHARHRASSY